MLVQVLLAEFAFAIFLAGALVIALAVTLRHGDPSAAYRLYAIRDKLIDACIFEGVPRDNPWLDTFYENVNSVLLHSNMLGGPSRWSLAVAVGQYQAIHPKIINKLKSFPDDAEKCPEPIRALAPEMRSALEHLSKNHIGFLLQTDARERKQRRIQREQAKELLEMMRDDNRCGCAA